MDPFQNESEVIEIRALTFENRVDRVTIYGDIDVTRDKRGLKAAQELYDLLGAILNALKSELNLPDQIEIIAPERIDNPFE
jgi:hypothetical protein